MTEVGNTTMTVGKHITKIFTALLLYALAAAAAAQPLTLDDINFTALPGNAFEVELDFSGTPPQPQAYTLDSPARIVLDFAGVASALAQKKYPLSFENAQSAVVVTSDSRTRLVINLNRAASYSTQVLGDRIRLQVAGSEYAHAPQPTAPPQTREAPVVASGEPAIEHVDFSRGSVGEGLIKLSLSSPNVSVDVQQQGSRIEVSFFNTSLPSHLDRRLDVTDFATPVRAVDAKRDGSTTRITVEAAGEFDYLAYQADREYVISVKPLTREELEEKKAKFAFIGEKLSLNFQDIEVRSVLQLIADFTDLNLVASDTVSGRITLRLDNVPWDQALDIVLKAKGLDKRLEGNVLMVAPAVEIAERERLQVEANKQLEELAPLVTEFIRIKYADAKALFDLFDVREEDRSTGSSRDRRSATKSILSERGAAIVDQRTNTIILTDTQEKIDSFKNLVSKVDIPVRQVEITARIVVASTDFRKEVGVRWGAQGGWDVGSGGFGITGGIEGLQDPYNPLNSFPLGNPATGTGGGIIAPGAIQTSPTDDNIDIFDGLNVDLGVANPAGKVTLELLTKNLFLDLELSALESDGYAEVASQPKVLTGDKQEATISTGQQVAYQEATSSGATAVKFVDALLELRVTPQITPDNRVILDLKLAQNSIAAVVFNGVPAIDKTEVETRALVGDGQTLVLGGIFQYRDSKGQEKVPMLGDIPYLGRLFRNDTANVEKREILFFITPRIVDDQLLDR